MNGYGFEILLKVNLNGIMYFQEVRMMIIFAAAFTGMFFFGELVVPKIIDGLFTEYMNIMFPISVRKNSRSA